MKKLLWLLLFAVICVRPAHADNYVPANWSNLAKTLVRFSALSLDEDKTLDDYAAITECDLYKTMHNDDFKWNTVRTAIKQSIRQNIAVFPTNYSYDIELQLGHYDFKQKEYKLSDKTVIQNVNTFVIYQNEGGTCGVVIKTIPRIFRAVLDIPVTFEGLPLDEKDGQALLERMKANGNIDRILYTRFNLRISYIEPVHKEDVVSKDTNTIMPARVANTARIDAHLDSMDFYEDQAMTKLVYTYRP